MDGHESNALSTPVWKTGVYLSTPMPVGETGLSARFGLESRNDLSARNSAPNHRASSNARSYVGDRPSRRRFTAPRRSESSQSTFWCVTRDSKLHSLITHRGQEASGAAGLRTHEITRTIDQFTRINAGFHYDLTPTDSHFRFPRQSRLVWLQLIASMGAEDSCRRGPQNQSQRSRSYEY